MSDGERHSIAAQPSLITDPIEEAKRESENAVAQFDRVLDLIDVLRVAADLSVCAHR